MVGNIIQGYEIQKCVQRGSISDIYFAKNQQGKYAIIKLLQKDFWGKEEQLQLKKEADIMQQFAHPNIPRFYGYDEVERALIMEYLEGKNLADYLTGLRNIDPKLVLNWALEILKTLHYFHEEGVIHTDIKPANLFLTKTSKVYLIDFGTAIVTDIEEDTNATKLLDEKIAPQRATHAYMSPEQSRQEVYLDEKTDIYSLGISCYELITGKKPFEAQRTNNLVSLIRYDNIPKHPALDNHLYEILLKATAKSPQDRYQKAIEFEAAIQQYLTPAKPQKKISHFWLVGAVIIILIAILFLFNPFEYQKKENASAGTDSSLETANVVIKKVPKTSIATTKDAAQKGGKVTSDTGNQKVVETKTTVTIVPPTKPSANVLPLDNVEVELKADMIIKKYGSLLTALPELKKLKNPDQREVAALKCENAAAEAFKAENYRHALSYYQTAQVLNPSKATEYQKKINEIMVKSK